MFRPGRAALACALAALVAGAAVPSVAAAQQRPTSALLAIWQAGPTENLSFAGREPPYEPADLFLRVLERRPGLSIGLMSTVQGDYSQEQALLDISQGTRQSTFIYQPKDYPRLALQPLDGRGRIVGWGNAVRRATTASATIRPGLLASSIPGGAGYAGVAGRNADGAVAAANAAGGVAAVSLGPPTTLASRAQGLLRSKRFVVVSLRPDATGLAALDQLIVRRAPGELLLIAQLPFTPPPSDRSVAKAPTRYYKQPAFALADGGPARGVTSATTRQPGLVSAIDIAPTVLTHLEVPVPNKVRGERIVPAPKLSAMQLEEGRRRWADVRGGRQSASLRAVAALATVVLLAFGAWKGLGMALAPSVRIGALGLMWWPTMVLVSAAFEPQWLLLESAVIAVPSIALAALTDRLVPWPRGPAIPAAAALIAYTVDLAGGLDLLTRSALGPSLAFGARFYGISNELEPLLPIMLLVVLAAVFTGRPPRRGVVGVYAACGVALGVVVGWGRLGADVGGVLTLAGAVTVAALVMLPGGVTRRALVVAALMPVAALAGLIVIDLALSGGGHLSRNLLRAENAGELWELVARRYELAAQSLVRGRVPAYFAAAALAVAFAWRNRELIYGSVRHERCWQAVLLGGLAAGVVGALTNDSGPILLINAVIALAAVSAYLFAKPGMSVAGIGAEPTAAPAQRRPADPILTG
jgi:hypothetical protein